MIDDGIGSPVKQKQEVEQSRINFLRYNGIVIREEKRKKSTN